MNSNSSLKPKLIRITTVAVSMNIILRGQLKFMSSYFEVIGITTENEKHFYDIQNREGIRVIPVKMARDIALLNDVKSLLKLCWIFYKERPDIVHTQTPKAGLLGMLAAWIMRVPVRIHTVGGLPLLGTIGIKKQLLKVLEKLTYTCAHCVYPNSKGLRDILIREGLGKRFKILGNGGSNGIDSDFFSTEETIRLYGTRLAQRNNNGFEHDDFIFLFVGRMAKEKGFTELIFAFEKIVKEYPERKCKLLLIGTFEEAYGSLPEVVKREILNNKSIIKPGRFDDVRPFYLISDVYTFPSYREGFPNTLLEAGAMSLASIATDINGCNEIITHYENGLLIPVKDENALFLAMEKLLCNNNLREELGTKSRVRIVNKFKRELVWNSLLREYNYFLTSTYKSIT